MLAKSPPTLPIVRVRDGEVVANSKDVADYFDKAHDDVLRTIRKTIADASGPSPQFCGNAFSATTYTVNIGSGARRQFPAFDMTRDGFTLLVMGFTGKVAMAFKVAYIERFNQLERELRAAPAHDSGTALTAARH